MDEITAMEELAAVELLENKTVEATLLRVLLLSYECKDLEELTQKIKEMLNL